MQHAPLRNTWSGLLSDSRNETARKNMQDLALQTGNVAASGLTKAVRVGYCLLLSADSERVVVGAACDKKRRRIARQLFFMLQLTSLSSFGSFPFAEQR